MLTSINFDVDLQLYHETVDNQLPTIFQFWLSVIQNNGVLGWEFFPP